MSIECLIFSFVFWSGEEGGCADIDGKGNADSKHAFIVKILISFNLIYLIFHCQHSTIFSWNFNFDIHHHYYHNYHYHDHQIQEDWKSAQQTDLIKFL